MNPIDIAVLIVVGLSFLFGLYRGFLQTLFKLAGGIISLLLSFSIYPKLSDILSTNTSISKLIATYTDSNSLLGNLDLSSLSVNSLSSEQITSIVQNANLPYPIDTLLLNNLQHKVFSPLGSIAEKVGDYLNQTILSVSLNVVCFLVCFLLCFLLSNILINAVFKIGRLPVLRHLNALAGGVLGILLGILLCFAIFSVLPVLESIIQMDEFRTMVEESQMGKVFSNSNLLISIMNRKLNLSL